MQIRSRALLIGAATYIPGVRRLSGRHTGGTSSARYCYSVWLRHLCIAHRGGLQTTFATVVELGPGDSLGIGLAALLSGCTRYIALDSVHYADSTRNLEVFEQLVKLFRDREPIPDATELPLVQPQLPSYAFPVEILSASRLGAALDPSRLADIRAALATPSNDLRRSTPICYLAPWRPGDLSASSADLILSQSVLEYPDDLGSVYAEMSRWLIPGGVMSHEIDFKSIGTTKDWYGHWSCSDVLWRIAMGRRRHRINREPLSTHLALLRRAGCRTVTVERTVQPLLRPRLAPRFRSLTDEDLTTSSALIQAIKLT